MARTRDVAETHPVPGKSQFMVDTPQGFQPFVPTAPASTDRPLDTEGNPAKDNPDNPRGKPSPQPAAAGHSAHLPAGRRQSRRPRRSGQSPRSCRPGRSGRGRPDEPLRYARLHDRPGGLPGPRSCRSSRRAPPRRAPGGRPWQPKLRLPPSQPAAQRLRESEANRAEAVEQAARLFRRAGRRRRPRGHRLAPTPSRRPIRTRSAIRPATSADNPENPQRHPRLHDRRHARQSGHRQPEGAESDSPSAHRFRPTWTRPSRSRSASRPARTVSLRRRSSPDRCAGPTPPQPPVRRSRSNTCPPISRRSPMAPTSRTRKRSEHALYLNFGNVGLAARSLGCLPGALARVVEQSATLKADGTLPGA